MAASCLKLCILYISLTLFTCNSNRHKIDVESITNPLQLRHVTKITDGDTFYVADSTEKGEKIRLIGVDAPESRNMFKLKKENHLEKKPPNIWLS